jgi:hypothetical protein
VGPGEEVWREQHHPIRRSPLLQPLPSSPTRVASARSLLQIAMIRDACGIRNAHPKPKLGVGRTLRLFTLVGTLDAQLFSGDQGFATTISLLSLAKCYQAPASPASSTSAAATSTSKATTSRSRRSGQPRTPEPSCHILRCCLFKNGL